ncbi:hypothetical protein [Streptomyces chrestomyceticus]|uniref:hypothetical protein n=1 Tax=Streptomyces chrestomyceticus TaxID=68185 RepID=UPI0035A86CCA
MATDASRPTRDKAVNRAFQRVDTVGSYFGSSTPQAYADALILQSRWDQNHKTVFAGADFCGSRHRLHIKGARQLDGTATTADRVELVTGVCLFSNRNLYFTDENGNSPELLRPGTAPLTERLSSISVGDEISLYEYETITRHSRLLADIAAALPPTLPLTITVDVPRVQYYLYLLDAFQNGLVPTAIAQRWFRLVDDRHTRVLRLFCDRIRCAVTATGHTDVTVRTAPGLNPLAECLQEAIATGRIPHDDELLSRMIATGDPVWEVLQHLEVPSSREHLGHASYVAELLRAAGVPDAPGNTLSISVDNYAEGRLFDQAQHLQQQLDLTDAAPPALAIYSAEAVQTLSPSGLPTQLYLSDPGRYAVDENDTPIDLFRLVDNVYAR